jgi:8-oxo-dGTP pyrophosphatase MutT (NUDIX family)
MIHERTAGRVLIVAHDRSTLLILGHDPHEPDRGRFYWTPGGGIDGGESLVEGTRRELEEEIGLSVDDLGPVVLERVAEFDFGGRRIRQTESFFIVEVPDTFEAAPDGLSALELDAIIGFVWRTSAEMRQEQWPVYPRCLPDLVDHFAEAGRPAVPWTAS